MFYGLKICFNDDVRIIPMFRYCKRGNLSRRTKIRYIYFKGVEARQKLVLKEKHCHIYQRLNKIDATVQMGPAKDNF